MLNKDFYPTPRTLIQRMLSQIDLDTLSSVLEPSAGKGDICDYIRDHIRYGGHTTIDVIEIEPELQNTLKGKQYNLVFDDFLSFDTNKVYDLIAANFPFSDGDLHLQKAIQLLEKSGGSLVCLVNAQTLRNPHTALRATLVRKLEAYHADIEYLPGEFTHAERPTDVEVALIRLTVPAPDRPSLILDGLKKAPDQNVTEEPQSQVIETNFLRALVARFDLECRLGIKLIDEYFALKPHIQDHINRVGEQDPYGHPLIELQVKDAYQSKTSYINCYLAGVRQKYWELLIHDHRFSGAYTSNILKELSQKLIALRDCDFNLYNIDALETELRTKIAGGVEASIISLFDELSRKFSWHEELTHGNIHYFNGWKTNKSYKINEKVIIPMNGFSAYSYGAEKLDYHVHDRLRDMVKVFNYFADDIGDVALLVNNRVEQANRAQHFREIDMRYFDVTFYKKGTCHVRFKDKDLLDRFNIFGSQRKGWLPPSYGKKHYRDMSGEERAVVDDFQGEEAYERVMENPSYLALANQPLQLTEAPKHEE